MRSLLLALQFLSIVPVRVRGEVTPEDLLRSAVAFPLVGLVAGALLVAADLGLGAVFPQALTSAIVLLVLVVFTGGFHLDGLSDMFDAMACKGGAERRLEVMRESTAGPAGVVAVVFSLGLKFLAIDALAGLSVFHHYFALLFMPVAGRWAMLAGMLLGRPARPDGLGSMFISRLGWGSFVAATSIVIALMAGFTLCPAAWSHGDWHVPGGGGLIAAFALAALFSGLARRVFGGQTGDTLGATGDMAETVFLLWVIGWSRLFI